MKEESNARSCSIGKGVHDCSFGAKVDDIQNLIKNLVKSKMAFVKSQTIMLNGQIIVSGDKRTY